MKEEDIRLIKQEIKNNRKAGECGLTSNNEKFEWTKTADALEKLLDYITNLQTIEQQYSAILSKNAELENKITNLQDERNSMACLSNDLQEIIDEAVEYIKEKSEEVELNFYGLPDKITSFKGSVSDLLKILKGKSDE